jgi:quinol monooxygenase YgiN
VAQTVLPSWVRARALAAYLLVFFGSLALGSLTWGTVASFVGLRTALALAAVGAALSTLLRRRFPLRGGEDLDLSPSRHWPIPGVEIDIDSDQGPVLVTVEYRVDPERLDDFRRAMEQVGRARQRDGAYYWDLFVDTAEPGRLLEIFLSDSWLEHLRQHERVTEDDRFLESQARRFAVEARPLRVDHLVSVRKRRRRDD